MYSQLKAPINWLAALVVVVLGVFVTRDFAYSDDYLYAHWFGHLGMDAGESQFFMHGRPVLYYLMDWVFSSTHTVPDMAYIRVLSQLGLVCFGVVAYRMGICLGLSKNYSVLLAMIGSLNPATMVFLGFASTYSYPWCAALALWLNLRLLGQPTGCKRVTLLAAAYCAIVLFLILLIYQPMAFLFIIPATLAVIMKGAQRAALLTWGISLVILIASAGIYFCYIKFIGAWAYAGNPEYLRGGLDLDLIKKGATIFKLGIVPALESWGTFSGVGYISIACQLVLIACGVAWKCSLRHILLNLAISVVCLGTLFVPLIVSKDIFISFRILHGVYFFFVSLSLLGLVNLLSFRSLRVGATPMATALIVGITVSVASLYYFFYGIVKPHCEEYTKYRNYLFTHLEERPWHVSFHSGYLEDYSPSIIPERLEYGTIASKAAWSHMGIINLIVNEKFGYDPKKYPVWVDFCHHTLVASTFHTFFLDADSILRGKHSLPATQRKIGDSFVDPCFGELTKTGTDEYRSPLFGIIDAAGYPTLSVEKIGKGRPEGNMGDSFWFYLDYTRIIQVNPALLPTVYDVSSGQWVPITDL